jgi:hypothetical protein
MTNSSKKQKSETSPEILMLAYLCTKGADNLNEKVSILDRFSLSDFDIASICDCSQQSVWNARSSLSNHKKGRKR